MTEESLLVLKPDAVLRRFVSVEALRILLSTDYGVSAFREMVVSTQLAQKHYAVHEGKPFYDWLIRFITSGPVLAMRVQGEDVIQGIRKMLGSTFAHKAEPATLRGKYGIYGGVNVAHASDAPESSAEELQLWKSEVGLTQSPLNAIRKKMSDYIRTYSAKKLTDRTQELRGTCIGIVEHRIDEEEGRTSLLRLLNEELRSNDRKYLKGFSEAILETCMMDRMKK